VELAELQSLSQGLSSLAGCCWAPISAEEYCREVLHPGLMQVRVLTGSLHGL
jgi:hypothetical protein